MPNSFTPQQIEQFLQEFFDTVGARQYIGARYVPIFGRAGEDSVEWDDGAPYEPLTVVMHQGVSYVSRRYVPQGIQITDTDYWVETYRFNAQVEQYRQEVLGFQDQIDQLREDMEADFVPFPDELTLPKYGTLGQVLSTLANGATEWVDPVIPDSETVGTYVDAWLDDHPEATTTVQDGSLTLAKFTDDAMANTYHNVDNISGSQDMDDIVATGTYRAYYTANHPLPAHFPTNSGAHLVIVLGSISYGYWNIVVQLTVPRNDVGPCYYRQYNSVAGGWTDWKEWDFISADDLDNVVIGEGNVSPGFLSQLYRKLPETTDLNLVTDNGVFYVGSSVRPLNMPDDAVGAYLAINMYHSASYSVQWLLPRLDAASFYYRINNGGTWTSWFKCDILRTPTRDIYINHVDLTGDDDMDSVTDAGIYRAYSGSGHALPSNFPVASGSYLVIVLGSIVRYNMVNQLLIPRNFIGSCYYRQYNTFADGWTEWKPWDFVSRGEINAVSRDYSGTYGVYYNRSTKAISRIGAYDETVFDYAYPWCAIQEVNISFDGSNNPVFTYRGQSGFSYNNDTFIEVPKFYFRHEVIGNDERWLVSPTKAAGFEVEPWFLDGNGNEVDYRYIAKYQMPLTASGKASVTGYQPQNRISLADAKTYLNNLGFDVCSYYAYQAIEHLMIAEMGTFTGHGKYWGISWFTYITNSNLFAMVSASGSNIIRIPYTERNSYLYVGAYVYVKDANYESDFTDVRRITDLTIPPDNSYIDITFSGDPVNVTQGVTKCFAAMQPSGLTDGVSGMSGVQPDVDPKVAAFKYRGVENFYGNLGEFVDGLTFDATNMRFVLDGNTIPITTNPSTNFAELNEGSISDFMHDRRYPAITLPVAAGRTFDQPYFSEFSKFGNTQAVHSCAWDHFVANDINTIRIVSGSAHGLYGARAEYRG